MRWNAALDLTPERAKKWFAKILQAKLSTMVDGESILLEPEFMGLNKKFTKRLQTTYKARPLFEHLYISNDLRVIKTQREAKQRPSYYDRCTCRSTSSSRSILTIELTFINSLVPIFK